MPKDVRFQIFGIFAVASTIQLFEPWSRKDGIKQEDLQKQTRGNILSHKVKNARHF